MSLGYLTRFLNNVDIGSLIWWFSQLLYSFDCLQYNEQHIVSGSADSTIRVWSHTGALLLYA